MASVVDICNLALAHLGDAAAVSSISPSDGSAQADLCARFYPIARDALLEMHAWDFATSRSALAETANTPPGAWAYQYAMPPSYLKALSLLPEGAADDTDSLPFQIESDSTGVLVINTNVQSAEMRYLKRVTDPTKFSPMFTNALSFLLASYLAGPVTKDPAKQQTAYKLFLVEFGRAAGSNANAQRNDPRRSPDWMKLRGSVSPYLADGRIER